MRRKIKDPPGDSTDISSGNVLRWVTKWPHSFHLLTFQLYDISVPWQGQMDPKMSSAAVATTTIVPSPILTMGHFELQSQVSHSDRSPWNQTWSLTMATASSFHLIQEAIEGDRHCFPEVNIAQLVLWNNWSTLLLAQSTNKGYVVPEHDHGRITGPRHHLSFRISTQCWMYRFVSFIKLHWMCFYFRYRNVWGCLLH